MVLEGNAICYSGYREGQNPNTGVSASRARLTLFLRQFQSASDDTAATTSPRYVLQYPDVVEPSVRDAIGCFPIRAIARFATSTQVSGYCTATVALLGYLFFGIRGSNCDTALGFDGT